MDVHGTKLARTLFTIAREWNAVPPNKGMELQLIPGVSPLKRSNELWASANINDTFCAFPCS